MLGLPFETVPDPVIFFEFRVIHEEKTVLAKLACKGWLSRVIGGSELGEERKCGLEIQSCFLPF